MTLRRRWMSALPLAAAAAGLGRARAADAPTGKPAGERFPGDPPQHKLVYQLNRAEPEYMEAILNSVGAMIGK